MTKLTKETATEMYNSGIQSIVQFALENYPELAPKKKWFEELEKGDYHIKSSIFDCFMTTYGTNGSRLSKHTFTTEEKADLFAQKITLFQEMTRFKDLRNGDWVADYNNEKQAKYGIIYIQTFKVNEYNFANLFIFGIAVKSKEIAEEMLEAFKDRLYLYNL